MPLRLRIHSGFLVLAVLLLVAGVWTTWEMRSVGSSVQGILDENYRSIHAATMMVGALEREDSGVLLLLLGQWTEGRATLAAADSVFNEYLSFAERNVTVAGEAELLESIREQYTEYRSRWERPIVDTPRQGDIDWYSSEVHGAFEEVRASVTALAELNQQSLYRTASSVEIRASRAVRPGLVAILACLSVTVVFSFLLQHYVVTAILRIREMAREASCGRMPDEVLLETRGELYDLANYVAVLYRASLAARKEA